MFGGFNLVRLSDDRKGSNFLQIDADVFNDFIHRSGLVELQMGGRRFTRISRDGAKLSKLDRFFVSSELINLRPNAHVVCLYCGLSDHCPFLLHVETHDFGPCPFKLFNSWLDIPSLEVIVKKVWSTSLFDPRPNVVFQSELKALKLSIKSWCKVEDEKNSSTFNSLTDQMAKFDKVAEERNLLEVAMHLEEAIEGGVARNEVNWMASTLKFTPGSLPFNYLGLPVGANMPISRHCLKDVNLNSRPFDGIPIRIKPSTRAMNGGYNLSLERIWFGVKPPPPLPKKTKIAFRETTNSKAAHGTISHNLLPSDP
nr:hypothetical protein [Tanacetum cinerariifolium]